MKAAAENGALRINAILSLSLLRPAWMGRRRIRPRGGIDEDRNSSLNPVIAPVGGANRCLAMIATLRILAASAIPPMLHRLAG